MAKSSDLAARLALFMTMSLLMAASAPAQMFEDVIKRMPTTLYFPTADKALFDAQSTPEKTVKDLSTLSIEPKAFSGVVAPVSAASAANAFLLQNSKELGIQGNVSQYQITSTHKTLSSRFVTLEQRVNGLPVVDGHIQIKVADDGSVQSVTRNIVAVPVSKTGAITTSTKIDDKAAQEIAWKDLGATGELLEKPSVDKAYLNESNVLTLIYVVRLAVSKPFGYWEEQVDANTGRVISRRDRRVKERKTASPDVSASQPQAAPLPGISLDAAISNLSSRVQLLQVAAILAKNSPPATANAMIFLPNPVTTLQDDSLRMNDPATKFEPAYRKVVLEDVLRSNGSLHLTGKLVQIVDFEPGEGGRSMQPSTTTKDWTARRGNNAFDDVMSYYHIRNSLLYLQSLGYKGESDLFPVGIAVDTDGVNGEDNSHYVGAASKASAAASEGVACFLAVPLFKDSIRL